VCLEVFDLLASQAVTIKQGAGFFNDFMFHTHFKPFNLELSCLCQLPNNLQVRE